MSLESAIRSTLASEAGDGEDGRVKSAIGIGTLLEEGIGDTIRVSLTEEPEAELPVCRDILKVVGRRESRVVSGDSYHMSQVARLTTKIGKIGGGRIPVVISNIPDK